MKWLHYSLHGCNWLCRSKVCFWIQKWSNSSRSSQAPFTGSVTYKVKIIYILFLDNHFNTLNIFYGYWRSIHHDQVDRLRFNVTIQKISHKSKKKPSQTNWTVWWSEMVIKYLVAISIYGGDIRIIREKAMEKRVKFIDLTWNSEVIVKAFWVYMIHMYMKKTQSANTNRRNIDCNQIYSTE